MTLSFSRFDGLVYRAHHPAWAFDPESGEGAKLHGGRFNRIGTACFYAAVVYLPLADVMSFYMAGPIYVAALSHLVLGEKVGWRRWLAILLGF